MPKRKEYEFLCRECGGLFHTYDIGQPICRGCWSKTGFSRALLTEMWGYPEPSPKQAVKWKDGAKWAKLIREEQHKKNQQERSKKL